MINKKYMKKAAVLCAIGVLSISLAACGGSSSSKSSSYDYDYSDSYSNSSTYRDKSSSGDTESVDDMTGEQLYSMSGDATIQTKEYDDSYTKLRQKITDVKGVLQNVNTTNNDKEWYTGGREKLAKYRVTNITVSVPSDQFAAFMEGLGDIGHVMNSNTSMNNETGSYTKNKAKIEVLQDQKARLQTYLDQAKSMDEMLKIEKQIEDVNLRLYSIQGVQNRIDTNVQYSTVNIRLEEVVKYTEVKDENFFTKCAEVFTESISALIAFIKWIIYAIVGIAPFAIFFGAIAGVLFIIYKALGLDKKKAQKRADAVKKMNLTPYMQQKLEREKAETELKQQQIQKNIVVQQNQDKENNE